MHMERQEAIAPGDAGRGEFGATAWPESPRVTASIRGVPGRSLRRRRGIRRLAAGLLLVIAGLFATAAQGQTTTTLVSNLGNSSTGVLIVGYVNNGKFTNAHGFTTGDNSDGYTLEQVVVEFGNIIGASTPRVSIYTSSSGTPGTLLYTLTNPSSVMYHAANTFTAPPDAHLAKETTYFIVFEETIRSTWYLIADTGSGTETAAANGWSLANQRYERSSDSGTWTSKSNQNVLLKIEGVIDGSTATIPGAPTLTAVANGQYQIDLSWDSPGNDGGAAISGYKIEASSNDGNRYFTIVSNTGTPSTSYSHTGLFAGDSLIYRVSAINSAGTGPTSNGIRATTDAIPSSPNELVSNLRLAENTVHMGANELAQGFRTGERRGGYDLDSVEMNVRVVPSSSDASLVTVTLWKEDTNNRSRPGASVAALANPSDLSGVPGTKTFSAPANTVLEANTNYFVKLAYSGTSDFEIEGTGSNREDSGHATGWFIFDVSLERARGSSVNWSASSTVTAIRVNGERVSPIVPDVPTDLTAMANGATQIDLTWRAPSDTGGSPIAGYRIEVSSDSGANWSDLVADTGSRATTYSHTSLPIGTTRHYQVSAINSVGTGSASRVANATAAHAPGAPTDLMATAYGPYYINLSWDAPSEDGGSPILGYRIDASSNGGLSWYLHDSNTDSTATNYSDYVVFASTTRHYRVSALNAAGTGPVSNPAGATTAGIPASANELVSNLLQFIDIHIPIGEWEVAQGFTTGGNTWGYTLESVDIDVRVVPSSSEASLVTVTLWKEDTSDDGRPGSSVATLGNPSDLSGAPGTKTFSAPANTVLEANTNYFVKMAYSGTSDFQIGRTRSNGEDAGRAPGWSVLDGVLQRPRGSSDSWTLSRSNAQIRVNGAAASTPVSTQVALSVDPTTVAENVGGTPVTVTGTLEDARAEATSVTVTVGAAGDEAVADTDYAAVDDLTLTIGTGQTSGTATFTLTPDNDTLGEGDEKISVTGTTTATGITVTGTELTITDDDSASTEVELSVSLPSVAEDAAGTSVTVTGTLDGGARTEATTVTVSIGAATDTATEGTDYATVDNFTLTINAEQTSGTATFTLTPDNDTLGEGDEEISVTGTTTATGLTVTGTEMTITDDDTASTEVELSVNLASVAEDAAGTSVTVTGTLDGAARTEATTVTVSVGAATDTATEGTDYTTVNDLTLTINAEQTSGTATFTLTPDNDTLGEGDEEISVTGTTTATGLTVTGTEMTITDDDTASTEVELSVNLASVAEDAAGTSVTVTGTLDGAARTEATTVTVSVGAATDTATEGTDYAAVDNFTLTINAEQTSGTATFTLTPDNDTLGEGDEEISVTGTTTATGLTVTGTELTITDDDTASTEVELSVNLASVVEDAAGTSVTVTGTLDGAARTEATSVTVSIGAATDTATEGTDYTTVDDLTLTISAEQTSGTATFTLTPDNDTLGEGDEKISVTGTTTATGLTVTGTELTITDDETVSTEVELSVSHPSVVEDAAAGTVVTVTGTLNGGARTSDTSVTVSVGATGDEATEGTDYVGVDDRTLTISAGETSGTATFTLTPTNDELGEGGETVSVGGTTTASDLRVSGTELTITDDDSASTEVKLSVSPASVAENAAGTAVTVTGILDGAARTEATSVTVSVGAPTDTATEGTDYTTVEDFTLTIDSGEASGTATFTLTPRNDTLGEGAEQISVGGTTTAAGLTVSGTELAIIDDDSASTEVELSVSLMSVAEDAAGTSVTVTGTLDGAARTEATTVTVSVGAATDTATEGADYATVDNFTLTINAEQTSGTATFTLTPDNDTLGEVDETISVTGTTTAAGLTVTGTELTITDDDSASTEVVLSVSLTSVAEDAAGTSVTVTGTLDGAARTEATTVTVSIGAETDTATAGTDYAEVDNFTLTINAEQTSGTATFTLTPDNDTLGEVDETISVTGTTTATGLTVTGTEMTITDDDSASTEVALSVSLTSVAEDAAGTSVTVTGTLDGAARTEATTVTVSVGAATDTATEGTDYAAVDNFTLTINAEQTSGTATFMLTPTNDTLGEVDETVSVTGTTTATGLTVTGTEMTITDDDSASTEVVLSVSLTSVAEDAAGTSVTVTGTLDGAARTEATTVTVSVGAATDTATEGTDYAEVDNFTLTIGAEQPSGTATFMLTPDNDTLGEGDEEISVTGTTTATGLTVTGTEMTITDDDSASTEVVLSVSLPSVAEDAAGTSVTVTGTLDGAARTEATTVTVSIGAGTDTATEGTDYTAVNDLTLTIGAEQTSGTATFTLTPDNDTLGEGDEEISVTGTTTATGLTVTGTELTITDDDTASTEVALSVSLPSVAEDAAGTSVTVTGTLDGAARTEATTVTVSVGAATDTATEGT